MKIVLIGGHLSPALALLEKIPSTDEIIFIGRKHTFEGEKSLSLEYNAVTERGIRFIPLTTGRFQRKLTPHTIPSMTKFPYGFVQAMTILLRTKPDVVVGFGGYLSVPVCLAARSLRIPVVIHEQTMRAGMANRMIGKFAAHVCISWDSSRSFFPQHRTVLTGNLIRKEVIAMVENIKKQPKEKKGRHVLFISGGSGGSHAVNMIIESCLPQLLQKYTVIHQTGDSQEFNDFDRLNIYKQTLAKELADNYELHKFIEPKEMPNVYANADVVIGRCGGNTMIELLLLDKPCLLIPLPHGQAGEQMANARLLQEKGLATIVPQDLATADAILKTVTEMLDNLSSYAVKDIDMNIHLTAAERIYKLLQSIYEKKQNKKPQN